MSEHRTSIVRPPSTTSRFGGQSLRCDGSASISSWSHGEQKKFHSIVAFSIRANCVSCENWAYPILQEGQLYSTVVSGKENLHCQSCGISQPRLLPFLQTPCRLGAVDNMSLSTCIPARASPGLNVIGVVKSVRCRTSINRLQTGTLLRNATRCRV